MGGVFVEICETRDLIAEKKSTFYYEIQSKEALITSALISDNNRVVYYLT